MATAAAAAIEAVDPGVERLDTIVIGGGQAGLSVGYYLKKRGRPFVILDANERIGGSWRTRTWDSLRSFASRITDRKSTRLNSSHRCISYAVFCLKKKKKIKII